MHRPPGDMLFVNEGRPWLALPGLWSPRASLLEWRPFNEIRLSGACWPLPRSAKRRDVTYGQARLGACHVHMRVGSPWHPQPVAQLETPLASGDAGVQIPASTVTDATRPCLPWNHTGETYSTTPHDVRFAVSADNGTPRERSAARSRRQGGCLKGEFQNVLVC